jgi:hypothetical protein
MLPLDTGRTGGLMKYFYAGGSPKNDARPAVEMSVSK